MFKEIPLGLILLDANNCATHSYCPMTCDSCDLVNKTCAQYRQRWILRNCKNLFRAIRSC